MRRKLIIFSSIIVLVLAIGSFWGYNHYLKPDPQIQQQLSSQFGSDFFTSFTENSTTQLGPVNSGKLPKNLNQETSTLQIVSAMEEAQPQDTNTSASPETSSASALKANPAKPVTQEEINRKYQTKFSYLQNQALSRLNTLYSAAVQEYNQDKKAGTLNRSELAQKYIQAGTMLEAGVDSQFYSTLNALQSELTAHNLPTDIINVYKSNYENAKSSMRSQLLAKIRK